MKELVKKLASTTALATFACLALATTALAETSLLSQGRPAWASSAQSDHPSTDANDGLAWTSWQADSLWLPQEWGVDLGAPSSLDSMTIQWSRRAQPTYTISGSNDGSRYEELFAGEGNGLMSHDLFGVYRYVMVTVTDSASWSPPRIVEAEVFGVSTSTPTPGASPGTMPAPIFAPVLTDQPDPVVPSAGSPTLKALITGRTFRTYVVPTGTQNVVYEDCTFTGGLPDWNGVLTLTNPCHDITFRNCVIDSGPVNGVTIVDQGGTISNITFESCTFRSSKRMGFECISRGSGSSGYRSINLVNCTFEPQGSEVISYDGTAASGFSTISGCTLKGGGTVQRSGGMGSGLELNGITKMTVTNNRIYACANGLLNLQMGQMDGYTGDSKWVITDNIIDASTSYGPVSVGSDVIGGINVYRRRLCPQHGDQRVVLREAASL